MSESKDKIEKIEDQYKYRYTDKVECITQELDFIVMKINEMIDKINSL